MNFHSDDFLKEHHDFVLKLKIKSTDDSNQIRRVRLPRLLDSTGRVSYDELVGLTIAFTFPEGSPQNYTVSLTYFDVDEDTVTIASTDELVDAIEQFASKKVLRLSTVVKPRSSALPNPSPRTAPQTTAAPPTTPREEPAASAQVKGALDTFVGILSMAVTHLQEGLAAPNSQPRATTVTITPVRDDTPPSPSRATPNPSPAPTTEQSHAAAPAPVPENQSETVTEEAKPFIHGRHTCDSCLVTPIVGRRFHATNLPDYDLCENCYSNYTGREVQFEEAELERDRPFQVRWHRRREKIERFQNRRFDRMHRRCGRGPPGRLARHGAAPIEPRHEVCRGGPQPPVPSFNMGGSPAPPNLPDPLEYPCLPREPPRWFNMGDSPAPNPPDPSEHPPCLPREPPRWFHGLPSMMSQGVHDFSSMDNTTEFDEALKEAIRRSLRDVAPREAELVEQSTPTSCGTDEAPEDIEAECQPVVVGVYADADEESAAELQVSPEPDIVVESEEVEQAPFDPEETRAMEDAMETGSVDSEKLLAEDERKPAATLLESEPQSSARNLDVARDDSFQSEAIGSGEIAEAVGATLDLVAGMISDMLHEADTPSKKSTVPQSQLKSPPEYDGGPALPEAVIVEGTFEEDHVAASEESGWHVVGTEDDFMQADVEIARAAEMLGSALFNSCTKGGDEHDSHGNVSHLSDSFSVPSTVPSLTVGEAQRSRWAVQLSKLEELGFDDEARIVEILERLQAANIGVGSDEDVSVTQVVNAILESK